MKTIEELYQEVLSSEALKKEFLALKPEDVEGFAASHGCEATLDDIKAFFEARQKSGTLSDEELSQVAGGKGFSAVEFTFSVLTAGTVCALAAIGSAIYGNVGTAIEEDDCMLCDV